MEYTIEQIQEFRKCADPVTGPEYFLTNYFMIQHPVSGPQLMQMQQYHLDFLHNIHSNQQSINLLSRQLGKTTLMTGYALWMALFCDDSTIVFAAAKNAIGKDMMQRLYFALANLPEFLRCDTFSQIKTYVHFHNGSRIMSSVVSANTGRGMSISLLMIDEFAYVRSDVAAEFIASVWPALSFFGKVVIASSLSSSENVFNTLWEDANNKTNAMSPFAADWRVNLDLDESWEKDMTKVIGREAFSREYLNKVAEPADA